MDREKVIKGFECCHVMVHDMGPSKSSCGICPYKDVQTEEQINLGGIECIAVLHDDALELLKEQEDLGTELTNAMELVHKKNERIKKLEEEIETLTKWRANAGAFD